MAKRPIKSDYLSGAESLRPFYRYPFPAPDYGQIIANRSQFPIDRALLVRELKEQNRGFSHSGEAMKNIQLLGEENTFTVTTGHQLVLMGGPMYMLYKIATAIKLAGIIQEKHPDYNIVPVFWMASEDHDWEEINHFHPGFFETTAYPGDFRGPVGRHLIEPEMEETLRNCPATYRELFQPGQDLATSFRRLILELFGDYGLVVIDADSTALKQALVPYMEAEVNGKGMGPLVEETSQKLESLGYKAQILPREFNLFYMGDGDRRLLVPDGDAFFSKDGDAFSGRDAETFSSKDGALHFSRSELLRLVRTHPSDFSPNVSMRPLYQEVLLPNLAYVGGWAETAYWMQLKSAFDTAGVFFPLLVPRMSAAILPRDAKEQLAELGFSPEDLERSLHELKEAYLHQHWDDTALKQAFEAVSEAYQHLVDTIDEIDKPLAGMAISQAVKAKKLRDKLQFKIGKAVRERNPKPYERIETLKNAYHPDGYKQERILNFTAFKPDSYAQFIALILEHCPGDTYSEQWIILP